jgi:hypothetical protein
MNPFIFFTTGIEFLLAIKGYTPKTKTLSSLDGAWQQQKMNAGTGALCNTL